MSSRKNILIITFSVVVMAAVIQFARSGYVFSGVKNLSEKKQQYIGAELNALTEEKINRKERDSYTIIYDSKEEVIVDQDASEETVVESSTLLKDNIVQTLKLMKKDYNLIDIRSATRLELQDENVIIALRYLDNIPEIDVLMDFIHKGHFAFLAITPELDSTFYRLYRKMGIYEANDFVYTKGIKFKTNVLLKAQGVSIGEDFLTNSSLAVSLDKKCSIHAVSLEDVPLLWDIPLGKGKLMVFNGTNLIEKDGRGLIAGALSLLRKDFIYPIMNQKIVYIDDFPAPFPEGYDEKIKQDYKRSTKSFFRDVWWPDIMRIGARYNIKYTGMIIGSYNDNVEAPFTGRNGVDTSNLLLYGRELLKNGGELGIHGYNHQSLVVKGETMEKYVESELDYKAWPNLNYMLGSIQSLMISFKDIYKNYSVTSYVPPSNVLGPLARETLKIAIPNLETIGSVYFNSLGEDNYVQEFDVAQDGIIEYPRLTFGYSNDESNRWRQISGITSMGIISHFIHPDDILDADRNKNKSWEELAKEFEEMSEEVYEKYSWLRSMTATEGGRAAKNFLESNIFIQYEEDNIKGYINGFSGDFYFILRTDKSAIIGENCTIQPIDSGAYLVCAKKPQFIINLSR